jgi:hypothetical protein
LTSFRTPKASHPLSRPNQNYRRSTAHAGYAAFFITKAAADTDANANANANANASAKVANNPE